MMLRNKQKAKLFDQVLNQVVTSNQRNINKRVDKLGCASNNWKGLCVVFSGILSDFASNIHGRLLFS